MIAFLQETLGAELLGRYPAPDGRVMHAALRVGDSLIEMGEPAGEYKPRPMALHIYLDDVEGAYERALAAGATSTLPITDQAYGDREGGVKDRWGNAWYLATHQEEVTEEELMQRFGGGGSKPRKQPGVGPRPEGYHTVTPFLHVRGARKMIAFLESAFPTAKSRTRRCVSATRSSSSAKRTASRSRCRPRFTSSSMMSTQSMSALSAPVRYRSKRRRTSRTARARRS
jgi:PhnB protein